MVMSYEWNGKKLKNLQRDIKRNTVSHEMKHPLEIVLLRAFPPLLQIPRPQVGFGARAINCSPRQHFLRAIESRLRRKIPLPRHRRSRVALYFAWHIRAIRPVLGSLDPIWIWERMASGLGHLIWKCHLTLEVPCKTSWLWEWLAS